MTIKILWFVSKSSELINRTISNHLSYQMFRIAFGWFQEFQGNWWKTPTQKLMIGIQMNWYLYVRVLIIWVEYSTLSIPLNSLYSVWLEHKCFGWCLLGDQVGKVLKWGLGKEIQCFTLALACKGMEEVEVFWFCLQNHQKHLSLIMILIEKIMRMIKELQLKLRCF